MREIITIQVGGGGNVIGEEFFSVIGGEHGIDKDGTYIGNNNSSEIERRDVFFKEGKSRFYARAIAVDSDPEIITTLSTNPNGCLYSLNNVICGADGAGNNYAKGFTETGKILLEPVMELLRLECECADSVQGIQVIHTLGGGTGSGLSALIWERLGDYLCNTVLQTISILPSPKLSTVIVEPYNCVLCFPNMLNYTHLTFCLDNEALYNICTHQLRLSSATYHDTNHLIAHAMSGITTSLRFPGQLNTGLRKLYVNMIPFPNLHFLVTGFAPILPCCQMTSERLGVPEIVMQIFNSSNILAAIELRKTKLLTVATIFRGIMSPKEVENVINDMRKKNSETFVDWIPNNIKTAYCDVPPCGLEMSATFIGNATGITKLFTRLDDQFITMYNRKAYLHWYTEHGMEEAQFDEAHNKLQEVVQEYEQKSKDSSNVESLDSGSRCGSQSKSSAS